MDSRKDAEFEKESAGETLNDSTLRPASSVSVQQQGERISEPAILDPYEDDDPLYEREIIKRPFKTYRSLMKSYNSIDVLADSEDQPNEGEGEQQTGGLSAACLHLFDRYAHLAEAFRNSYLIYILQIWLTLLPFSAIIMGNTYGQSCPGSPNLVSLTVLTGVLGVLLVGQWIALLCCPADDRPCEGQQKYGIFLFFILVAGMLELEIYLFSKLSPSFEPSTTNYCNKTFYNYTYYKFIAALGSALLVVLLYLPGYSSLASGVVCSDPLTGNCYRGMMEEED